MDRSLHIENLKEYFKGRNQFSIADIQSFYQKFEKEIKRSTLDWRIYELKNLGVIQKVGRGIYSLEKGQIYIPSVDAALKRLFNKVQNKFPFLQVCVWNTKWLNEFMTHQPVRFYILIEVEKDGMEPLFYFLKEHTSKEVFLNPSASFLEKYATHEQEFVLVTHLVTEAPAQEVEKTKVPTLEKMLVDIFSDDVIFASQQGQEMKTIFSNAFDKYLIDKPKLLRYAARRSKREELENYINSIQIDGTYHE